MIFSLLVFASAVDTSLFAQITDGVHAGLISFFQAAGFPGLTDCVDNMKDAVLSAKKAISIMSTEDPKDYYLAVVKGIRAVINILEEPRSCKDLPELFKEMVESMERFSSVWGIPLYLLHVLDNVQWNIFDIIRCGMMAYKAMIEDDYKVLGKYAGRLVFITLFDH